MLEPRQGDAAGDAAGRQRERPSWVSHHGHGSPLCARGAGRGAGLPTRPGSAYPAYPAARMMMHASGRLGGRCAIRYMQGAGVATLPWAAVGPPGGEGQPGPAQVDPQALGVSDPAPLQARPNPGPERTPQWAQWNAIPTPASTPNHGKPPKTAPPPAGPARPGLHVKLHVPAGHGTAANALNPGFLEHAPAPPPAGWA